MIMTSYSISQRLCIIAIPMVFLLLFFLAPFFIVAKISLSEAAIASPPYLPIISWQDGIISWNITLENYHYLWEDSLYIISYWQSIKIAFISTCITLIISYPLAYYMAKARATLRNILLILIILPFWTSFLLRTYAWIALLKPNGLINDFLLWLHVIDTPLIILQTDIAVYIGIVYTYLPFMILPIYAHLVRADGSLNEAAADLGAAPLVNFFTITLPLSLPGIIAGSLLVFIPAIGEFVIPALLGGPDTLMIGKILWTEFFSNRDWPVASSVAVVMLMLLIIPIMVLREKFGNKA